MIINQIVSGGSAPAHYIEKSVDANGKLVNSSNFIDLTGVTELGDHVLYSAYQDNALITSINFANIETISGSAALASTFQNCTGITSLAWNVKTISGDGCLQNTFHSCSNLQTADLSSTTSITGNSFTFARTFMNSGLTSINMNGLNVIGTTLGWNSVSYAPFGGCAKLESITFGGLTASTFANKQNQLQYIFNTNTGSQAPNGCTVHFPSNFDPSDPNHTFDASTLAGYPTFGGNASYIHVAFDLPATE